MTAGLVTRDANGVITANMTKRLSQGAGYVVTNAVNGSITINLPANRNYFYVVTSLQNSNGARGASPGVNISQNSLSWNYLVPSGGFPMDCRITYGYY